MDINNKVISTINIAGTDVWITETMTSTWIIMAIIVALALIFRIAVYKEGTQAPKGLYNFFEFAVESVHKFVISIMDEKYGFFGAYFFGLIFFILFSNLAGLYGLRPPTADLATTVALALNTLVIMHVYGIMLSKKQYWKDWISPSPLLLPLTLIGELAKPVSLSFRLFGNVLGGVIVIGILYGSAPLIYQFLIPVPLHGWFDLFAGGLQAFIFTILSLIFIRQKLPD